MQYLNENEQIYEFGGHIGLEEPQSLKLDFFFKSQLNVYCQQMVV